MRSEVSMWPSAQGWFWVVGALLAALFVFVIWFWFRRRALRLRGVAQPELQRILDSDRIDELPALVKRVPLATNPRANVAARSATLSRKGRWSPPVLGTRSRFPFAAPRAGTRPMASGFEFPRPLWLLALPLAFLG